MLAEIDWHGAEQPRKTLLRFAATVCSLSLGADAFEGGRSACHNGRTESRFGGGAVNDDVSDYRLCAFGVVEHLARDRAKIYGVLRLPSPVRSSLVNNRPVKSPFATIRLTGGTEVTSDALRLLR